MSGNREFLYADNYHSVLLEECTFEPMEYANCYGKPTSGLGRVTGKVVRGTTVNRLFHAVCVKSWDVGAVKSFDRINEEEWRNGRATKHTCG